MRPLELVKLDHLMERSSGRPEVVIGLIDGPVAMDHPDLPRAGIREVPGKHSASCSLAGSFACMHGTFVAGILFAKRGSLAPAICPECSLLVRPIFLESPAASGQMPGAPPQELASAIIDAIGGGANVINLSAALAQPSSLGERQLEQALDYAAKREVLVVAAAGNQGTVGSTAITRHSWVIAVIGCDLEGRLTAELNLGNSIGRWGLSAPGENITSLSANGEPRTWSGTSVAAPFVTGAIALLWSVFPEASAARIKQAVTQAGRRSRRSLAPPMLDAWGAFQAMTIN
jgi:subtilisin family serine protease